jgi:CubicO group peptidase (beta-lactamase class C family)
MVAAACTGAPDPGPVPGRTVDPGAACTRAAERATDLGTHMSVADPHAVPWETAAPGDVGLDPEMLEAGAEDVALSKSVASLLVVRHGELVLERYFNGSAASQANTLASLQKSILSLLTGAAIDDGYLEIDTPISEILPAELMPRDDGLTVRHLLTMSGGLEWDEGVDSDELDVVATLGRDRVAPPGEDFAYNTGLTHVLSAVLTEATGRSTCDYAREKLFEPLGVTADHWQVRPDGYFTGGDLLWLTPREIARFGQLVLQRGEWEGEQLVSEGWVQESTTRVWDFGCAGGYAPTSSGYGDLWWLSQAGSLRIVSAQGFGGQSLTIVPELDLFVVLTHHIWPSIERPPVAGVRFVHWFVLPAVEDLQVSTHGDCPGLDLYRVRTDGSGLTELTDHDAQDIAFSWSPDGERIAFHSQRDLNFEVYTMAADGSDLRRLTTDYGTDGFPRWSPDGGSIVFAAERGPSFDIYRMDPDGSDVERLTHFADDETSPAWSPDGGTIAFIRGVGAPGGGSLWAIDADGSRPRQLLERPVDFPDWSPEGTSIAFSMMVEGQSHVGILELATGRVRDLGPGQLPRWSPDGTKIVICGPGFRSIEIISVVDGSRTTLIDDVDIGSAIWSPDGLWIAFGRTPALALTS